MDAQGFPLDGAFQLRFSLYAQAEGGEALWFEEHVLQIQDGYYSAELGANIPFGITLEGEPRFLGISIDGGVELSPRFQLTSVPYALVAEDVSGDIQVRSLSIGGQTVINSEGNWIGAPFQGGVDGVPYTTPEQVLLALREVDGPGSALDADLLDGHDSSEFIKDGEQLIDLLLGIDGTGSGLDLDRIDGYDSSAFFENAADIFSLLLDLDGTGSSLDADLLGGHDSSEFISTGEQAISLLITVDGANSDIDVDRLDGYDGATFLRNNQNESDRVLGTLHGKSGDGSGLDADFVDGIEPSQFMRTDQDTSTSGDVTVGGALRSKNIIVPLENKVGVGINQPGAEADINGTAIADLVEAETVYTDKIAMNPQRAIPEAPEEGTIYFSDYYRQLHVYRGGTWNLVAGRKWNPIDMDGDGIVNDQDNCPNARNPNQNNSDALIENTDLLVASSSGSHSDGNSNFLDFSDSERGSYYVGNLIDGLKTGDAGSFWMKSLNGSVLTVKLPNYRQVTGVTLNNNNGFNSASDYEVFYSPNSSDGFDGDWLNIANGHIAHNEEDNISFIKPVHTQYLKIRLGKTAGSYLTLAEIELHVNTDEVGDACDLCRYIGNPEQTKSNNEVLYPPFETDPLNGDDCLDLDDDQIADLEDNCPNVFNPNQENSDGIIKSMNLMVASSSGSHSDGNNSFFDYTDSIRGSYYVGNLMDGSKAAGTDSFWMKSISSSTLTVKLPGQRRINGVRLNNNNGFNSESDYQIFYSRNTSDGFDGDWIELKTGHIGLNQEIDVMFAKPIHTEYLRIQLGKTVGSYLTLNEIEIISDSDQIGDACDICWFVGDQAQESVGNIPPKPFNEDPLVGVVCVDSDMDGISDLEDNCPNIINPNQENSDALVASTELMIAASSGSHSDGNSSFLNYRDSHRGSYYVGNLVDGSKINATDSFWMKSVSSSTLTVKLPHAQQVTGVILNNANSFSSQSDYQIYYSLNTSDGFDGRWNFIESGHIGENEEKNLIFDRPIHTQYLKIQLGKTIGSYLTLNEIEIQTETDMVGDSCDVCRYVGDPNQNDSDNSAPAMPFNQNPLAGDVCNDSDNDGVMDSEDNCPNTPNHDQANDNIPLRSLNLLVSSDVGSHSDGNASFLNYTDSYRGSYYVGNLMDNSKITATDSFWMKSIDNAILTVKMPSIRQVIGIKLDNHNSFSSTSNYRIQYSIDTTDGFDGEWFDLSTGSIGIDEAINIDFDEPTYAQYLKIHLEKTGGSYLTLNEIEVNTISNMVGNVCDDTFDSDGDIIVDKDDNCPTIPNQGQENSDSLLENSDILVASTVGSHSDGNNGFFDHTDSERGSYYVGNLVDGLKTGTNDSFWMKSINGAVLTVKLPNKRQVTGITLNNNNGFSSSSDYEIFYSSNTSDGFDGEWKYLSNGNIGHNEEESIVFTRPVHTQYLKIRLGKTGGSYLTLAEIEIQSGSDGFGDACDICWYVANPDQSDSDGDAPQAPYHEDPLAGDACIDTDTDGIPDSEDNCPTVANQDQLNSDYDIKSMNLLVASSSGSHSDGNNAFFDHTDATRGNYYVGNMLDGSKTSGTDSFWMKSLSSSTLTVKLPQSKLINGVRLDNHNSFNSESDYQIFYSLNTSDGFDGDWIELSTGHIGTNVEIDVIFPYPVHTEYLRIQLGKTAGSYLTMNEIEIISDSDLVGDACDICWLVGNQNQEIGGNVPPMPFLENPLAGTACLDSDLDGLIDSEDNCPNIHNANQENSDALVPSTALMVASSSGSHSDGANSFFDYRDSHRGNYYVGNLLDGSKLGATDSFWMKSLSSSTLTVKLPHAQQITGLTLSNANSFSSQADYQIFYSPDTQDGFDGNWHFLISGHIGDGEEKDVFFDSLIYAQYLKIQLGKTDGSYLTLNEIEVQTESDLVGDACDLCRYIGDPDQLDSDGNAPGMPFEEDPLAGDVCNDSDGDHIMDLNDNCPDIPNQDQANDNIPLRTLNIQVASNLGSHSDGNSGFFDYKDSYRGNYYVGNLIDGSKLSVADSFWMKSADEATLTIKLPSIRQVTGLNLDNHNNFSSTSSYRIEYSTDTSDGFDGEWIDIFEGNIGTDESILLELGEPVYAQYLKIHLVKTGGSYLTLNEIEVITVSNMIGNVCDNTFDSDGDIIVDKDDNCPTISNFDQLNSDGPLQNTDLLVASSSGSHSDGNDSFFDYTDSERGNFYVGNLIDGLKSGGNETLWMKSLNGTVLTVKLPNARQITGVTLNNNNGFSSTSDYEVFYSSNTSDGFDGKWEILANGHIGNNEEESIVFLHPVHTQYLKIRLGKTGGSYLTLTEIEIQSDFDELGDACDICWYVPNQNQQDSDNNAPQAPYLHDPLAGDHCNDADGDRVPDTEDNCPQDSNADQNNSDSEIRSMNLLVASSSGSHSDGNNGFFDHTDSVRGSYYVGNLIDGSKSAGTDSFWMKSLSSSTLTVKLPHFQQITGIRLNNNNSFSSESDYQVFYSADTSDGFDGNWLLLTTGYIGINQEINDMFAAPIRTEYIKIQLGKRGGSYLTLNEIEIISDSDDIGDACDLCWYTGNQGLEIGGDMPPMPFLENPLAGIDCLDSDSDGVSDREDNCPNIPNPNQENNDSLIPSIELMIASSSGSHSDGSTEFFSYRDSHRGSYYVGNLLDGSKIRGTDSFWMKSLSSSMLTLKFPHAQQVTGMILNNINSFSCEVDYEIFYSTDSSDGYDGHWSFITDGHLGDSNEDDLTFAHPINAQYFKIYLGKTTGSYLTLNEIQVKVEPDMVGDACDLCRYLGNPDQLDSNGDAPNMPFETDPLAGDACVDIDNDGIMNTEDNCPNISNPDQTNSNEEMRNIHLFVASDSGSHSDANSSFLDYKDSYRGSYYVGNLMDGSKLTATDSFWMKSIDNATLTIKLPSTREIGGITLDNHNSFSSTANYRLQYSNNSSDGFDGDWTDILTGSIATDEEKYLNFGGNIYTQYLRIQLEKTGGSYLTLNEIVIDTVSNLAGDACDDSDTDGDGIIDSQDNCPGIPNPGQQACE